MKKEYVYKLPWPPSGNHYYGNRVVGKRVIRYITAKGKKYREEVIHICGGSEKMEGRLSVTILAFPPDRRKRDLDNVFKCTLDSLEHAGVYENDNQVDELRITRGEIRSAGELIVHIEEI